VVTDKADSGQINGVTVNIAATQQNHGETNAKGEYKTGIATAGTYVVTFTHPQYVTKEVEAILVNGELTILDVELERRAQLVQGKVIESGTGNEIMGGRIKIVTENESFVIKAKLTGEFTFYANDEDLQLIAGSWGHQHKVLDYRPSNSELVIELDPGYQDDFTIDFDWVAAGDKYVGNWTRAIPIETRIAEAPPRDLVVNIGADVDGDIGEEAYVTGNRGGSAGVDDVDGTVILRSPHFNVSDYLNPVVRFNTYFFNAGGSDAPNDEMDISFADGTNFILFESLRTNTITWSEPIEINLKDLGLDLTKDIIMSLTVNDNNSGHLVEAAIDAFKIVEWQPSASKELVDFKTINVFPNPVEQTLKISTEIEDIDRISVLSPDGRKIIDGPFVNELDVSPLESGLYLLLFHRKDDSTITTQFIRK